MRKFKVGDRVRVANPDMSANHDGYREKQRNKVFVIRQEAFGDMWKLNDPEDYSWDEWELELVTNGDHKVKQRRTFKLIKELPDVRKGALFQERCDDGTQPYDLLDESFHKSPTRQRKVCFEDRELVEEAPQWFVEVFKVTPEYMTREELDAFEAFKKQRTTKTKTAVAKTAKPVAIKGNKPYWTPARRKAHAARMRAIWEAKKKAA